MSFFKKILEKILGTNTLYYPGCLTKSTLPEVQENYKRLLKQLGIDFIMLAQDEYCCGSPILRGGYQKAYQEIQEKNLQLFKKHAVGLIITNCPACYHMFTVEYELPKHGIQIEHISQTLARKKNKIRQLPQELQSIVYHDPCHLGRLGKVYEEPRSVLDQRGYQIEELPENRVFGPCCGGGGGLINANESLSAKICQKTLNSFEESGKKTLTSPCPMCYYQFKKYAQKTEVKEFADLFLDDEHKE